MNLRHLQTFIAVAEAGGIARAATKIHLSQPAASRQVLALEDELGVSLFDRIGRRIRLTSEGADLLQRSRRLLAEAASIGDRARALRGGHAGALRVGAPTQVIENLLAPFVPRYQQRHHGVDVHLIEAANVHLQKLVDDGSVHLGILPTGHDALHGRLLYPIYITAAVPPRHPLAKMRVLEISDLDDKPLLLLNRQLMSGIRSWFEAACDVAHAKPRTVFESAAPHTLVALAAENYGIAVVPSDVQINRRAVRLVPLVHRRIPIGRWACVAWDPRRFLPPYAKQFVDELANAVRRQFPGHEVVRRAPRLPRPPRPLRSDDERGGFDAATPSPRTPSAPQDRDRSRAPARP